MKSIKRLFSGVVFSLLLLSSCTPAAKAQEDLAVAPITLAFTSRTRAKV